jgi:uncharacterized phage-associated protein
METMIAGYNVRKAAQVVAFLVKQQGGKADLITTVKLAYLSDRRFLELYDLPILNDDFASMEHGPVDSTTYDYIKGQGQSREAWENYVLTDKPKNLLSLANADLGDDELDELSRAEMDVLREIHAKFGHYKPFDLVEYIHKHCPEWDDVPKGSSKYLSYERIFTALGRRNSSALTNRVYEYGNMESSLADSK